MGLALHAHVSPSPTRSRPHRKKGPEDGDPRAHRLVHPQRSKLSGSQDVATAPVKALLATPFRVLTSGTDQEQWAAWRPTASPYQPTAKSGCPTTPSLSRANG